MKKQEFKIGIIGHFGFGLDLANGQTIKTLIIANELEQVYGQNNIVKIDTHGGFKAIIPVIRGCIFCLKHCSNVIIMLTENGLKIVVPLLVQLNKKYKKKLHYVVIGGWLPSFLDKHHSLLKKIQKIDYVYVETNTMKKTLSLKGFDNVLIMPNCKQLKILKKEFVQKQENPPFKLCTFSRVMREKGIEDIVYAVININERYSDIVFSLDIYGQIDSFQIGWFESLSKKFPSYIKYQGVIPFDKSVEILKDYFSLIFPTRFFTEGVPGTILDAYSAGLPVVASKWESFADVVDESITGFGYDFNNTRQLEMILEKIASNPNVINNMRENCLAKAESFKIESALLILQEKLS